MSRHFTSPDWIKLRAEIDATEVRIVALDLPTSWNLAAPEDEFTSRMFWAVNNMMLDVLAAGARKDYEGRRRWQSEGTARAKAAGLYKGRPANISRNAAISAMLRDGRIWSEIMSATGCSRTLLATLTRGENSGGLDRPSTCELDFHLVGKFVYLGEYRVLRYNGTWSVTIEAERR